MRTETKTYAGTVCVGSRIRIVRMNDKVAPSRAFPEGIDYQARALNGKEGVIELIDDAGLLHGSWGGIAVDPKADFVEILG